MLKKKTRTAFLTLVLAVSLLGFSPKKANAGIVLVATGGTAGFVALGLGALSGVYAVAMDDFSKFTLLFCLGVIVLDADGSLPQDQLSRMLQTKYPFIENSDTFSALGQLIHQKASQTPEIDGKKFVSISRSELDQIFESVDLTGHEAKYEQMAKDLE